MDNSLLANHIPLNIQKQLSSRVTPLSNTTDGIPPRKPLRHFCTEVEEAVSGISVSVNIGALPPDAIARLAPLLLGAPAWAQIKESGPFHSWGAFKHAVQEEFELST